MIKANELRIGNWVDLGNNEEYEISCAHDIEEIEGYPEQAIPIPLTHELLKRCGFEGNMIEGITRLRHDIDDQDEEGDTYYWKIKVPKNDFVEDLDTFQLVQFGLHSDIKFVHQWLRVKVKYLHQLQNLYHSLTSSELVVTASPL